MCTHKVARPHTGPGPPRTAGLVPGQHPAPPSARSPVPLTRLAACGQAKRCADRWAEMNGLGAIPHCPREQVDIGIRYRGPLPVDMPQDRKGHLTSLANICSHTMTHLLMRSMRLRPDGKLAAENASIRGGSSGTGIWKWAPRLKSQQNSSNEPPQVRKSSPKPGGRRMDL